jgi:hypothetical protein
VLPYVPDELLENAEAMTNYLPNGNLTVLKKITKGSSGATTITATTLADCDVPLHVATPCNAMGTFR